MMSKIKRKCRNCTHCDIEELICRPNSKDCKVEYTLDEEDLDKEAPCDFYEDKREDKDAYIN